MGALHQDCNARECFSPTAARVTLFTPSILQCSLKSQRLQLRLTRLRLKGVDVCSYCISIFTVALLRELGKLPGHFQADLQRDARGGVIYLSNQEGGPYRRGMMRSLRACALSAFLLRLGSAACSCCPPSSEELWVPREGLRAGPCPLKVPELVSRRPWAPREGVRLPMAWLTRSPIGGPRLLASSAGFDQPSHM